MGVKIAILIGVSKYEHIDNLDACLCDVEVMYELIKQTNEYRDILFIKENVNSNLVKDQVVEFVKKHESSDEEIDQVFFYFTGHGKTNSSEVHFLLSNYEPSKLNSTSLQNSEVDSYLRLLSPKLAVKVIDACYSGATYIKDSDEQLVEKTLSESAKKKELKDCYFMFSSQNDEVSHAQRLSYFTESFVQAVLDQDVGTKIRFKNITDRISDTFSSIYKDAQTPKFVNQANLTEDFCMVTKELKEQVDKKLEDIGAVTSEAVVEEKEEFSLIEMVKKEAEDYCTNFSEIINAVDLIGEKFEDFTLPDHIADLYELSVNKGCINRGIPISNIDKYKTVLNILEENQNEYFVNVIYEDEEESINPYSIAALYPSSFARKKKPIDLEVLSGEIPFDYISIEIKAKYPSLKSYKFTLLIFLSRKNFLIMNSVAPYKEISWNTFITEPENITWIYREIKIKNTQHLTITTEKILSQCTNIILDEIGTKFEMQGKDPGRNLNKTL
ncbi:caspase family protein [Bacillus sp. 8YEL33]|uniref:caspase family protein n=1 Tax=Bacillus sp. 8YEL33 TaxID=2778094 RepID=UPI001C9A53F6|nr:caspase family protein [Bacillus sp. 8YEL33]MBY7131140.1 caspase family protein [Bacillus sp. 8YEL33]